MENETDEKKIKAFDFAADTTKQLISISTGIIALMVTFSKDIVGNSINSKGLLAWTWGIFILSIIFGVLTLMALTGTLQPIKKENEENEEIELDINNGNIRLLSFLQVLTFVGAIILTGIFGYKSLNNEKKVDENKDKYPIIRKSTLNNDTSKVFIDTLYLEKNKASH
jgi:NADH:ubiquinone oxidoreductase subunit 6 (subunit J)